MCTYKVIAQEGGIFCHTDSAVESLCYLTRHLQKEICWLHLALDKGTPPQTLKGLVQYYMEIGPRHAIYWK